MRRFGTTEHAPSATLALAQALTHQISDFEALIERPPTERWARVCVLFALCVARAFCVARTNAPLAIMRTSDTKPVNKGHKRMARAATQFAGVVAMRGVPADHQRG